MPKIQKLTPWERHRRQWRDCQLCSLCERRNRVVHGRGKIPADILFIGEAPGASEDVLGKPFVGPAGQLLDRIIESAVGDWTYFLTNIIGCIPKDESNTKIGEPPREAVEACENRLTEIVRMVNPKILVLVGKAAAKHVGDYGIPKLELVHPAAILRADISQRELAIQRQVVALADALEDLPSF